MTLISFLKPRIFSFVQFGFFSLLAFQSLGAHAESLQLTMQCEFDQRGEAVSITVPDASQVAIVNREDISDQKVSYVSFGFNAPMILTLDGLSYTSAVGKDFSTGTLSVDDDCFKTGSGANNCTAARFSDGLYLEFKKIGMAALDGFHGTVALTDENNFPVNISYTNVKGHIQPTSLGAPDSYGRTRTCYFSNPSK